MDSQTAVNIINSVIADKTRELEAFKFAENILTTGYNSDTARIETTIQQAKDAVAQEIADLNTKLTDTTKRAETAEASVATLGDSLKTEQQAHADDITSLTGKLTDAQNALETESSAHIADNTAKDAQIAALTPVTPVAPETPVVPVTPDTPVAPVADTPTDVAPSDTQN